MTTRQRQCLDLTVALRIVALCNLILFIACVCNLAAHQTAAMGSSPPVLYLWPPAWGLPSCSPACLQVEAYLRLAAVQGFQVQPCSTNSKSPTGGWVRGLSPCVQRNAYARTALHRSQHLPLLQHQLRMHPGKPTRP